MSQFDNLKKKLRLKIKEAEDQEDRDIYTLMLEIVVSTDYATRKKAK